MMTSGRDGHQDENKEGNDEESKIQGGNTVSEGNKGQNESFMQL